MPLLLWNAKSLSQAERNRLSRCWRRRSVSREIATEKERRAGYGDFALDLGTSRLISGVCGGSTDYATDLERSRQIPGLCDRWGDIATDPGTSRRMAGLCDEISRDRDRSTNFATELEILRQTSSLCDGSRDFATDLENTRRMDGLCDGSGEIATRWREYATELGTLRRICGICDGWPDFATDRSVLAGRDAGAPREGAHVDRGASPRPGITAIAADPRRSPASRSCSSFRPPPL
jgi:hypothetical protein